VPRKLKDLLIDRVDLVDKGDNPGASVALFKRDGDDGERGDNSDYGDNVTLTADNGGLEKLFDMFRKLFSKEGVNDNMPQFDVKKFAEQHADEQLQKRVGELTGEQIEAIAKAMESLDENSHTPLILSYEVEKQEREAAIEALKQANGDDDDDEDDDDEDEDEEFQNRIPDEVWKNMPESVRKVVEESQREAKEANELAKRLEQQQLENAYITKAKQNFPTVITKADEVGPVLKRIADTSKQDYEVIEAVLKAAEEMVSKNSQILKELGGSGEYDGGDAWAKIDREAKELMKHDSSMSEAQAVKRVMKMRPELYQEYQKEAQGA